MPRLDFYKVDSENFGCLPPLKGRHTSLLPESGSFHASDALVESDFILRYITRILSLVELDNTYIRTDMERIFHYSQVATSQRISEDVQLLARLVQKCCFSLTSLVGALDILLRLIETRQVSFVCSTWRGLLLAALVMSEKMWEDNFVHPGHIYNQFMNYVRSAPLSLSYSSVRSSSAVSGSIYASKTEFMRAQLQLLRGLNFDLTFTPRRFESLVHAVMATEVPPCVFRVLAQHKVALVPRPLPAVPQIRLPSSRYGGSNKTNSAVWH